jgi:hypothetical protein
MKINLKIVLKGNEKKRPVLGGNTLEMHLEVVGDLLASA